MRASVFERTLLCTLFGVAAACGGDHAPPLTDGGRGVIILPPIDGGPRIDAPECGVGATLCAGECVATSSDPRHCGGCGTACASGEICAAGSCARVCPGELVDCGGVCRDTNADGTSCGGCGVECAAGEACDLGRCVLSCSPGLTDCGGSCRDLTTDAVHCGACHAACRRGEVCASSTCITTCEADLTDCGGICRDLASDPAHCGGCGVACAAGEICTEGACRVHCGGGLTDCGGACRDTSTDRGHCGGCGRACAAGENCCGACSDPRSDEANCGGCGIGCTGADACVAGTCRPRYTGYTISTTSEPFVDACAIPGHTEHLDGVDDGTSTITLPYELMLYDTLATTLWVSSNGLLGLLAPKAASTNDCLPDGTSSPTIAVFWDNLDLGARAGSRVCVATTGFAPYRRTTVTWSDAAFFPTTDDSMSFSAVLSEGTHVIDLVYGSMTGPSGARLEGDSATIGVQSGTGTAHQLSCNTATITAPTSRRFTPM